MTMRCKYLKPDETACNLPNVHCRAPDCMVEQAMTNEAAGREGPAWRVDGSGDGLMTRFWLSHDDGRRLNNWVEAAHALTALEAQVEELRLVAEKTLQRHQLACEQVEALTRERDEHQRERQRLAIQALQDLDRIENAERELAALLPYKALADKWRDVAISLDEVIMGLLPALDAIVEMANEEGVPTVLGDVATSQEPQGEPLEATTPPATAGEWHVYRYSNPNDGSEAPYEDLYVCFCEDGKSCELPNERFIDVYAEDYAEKVAITDQIVADHNAASRYDALTTEASPNE